MKRDPYRYFRIEARELVDQMSKGMLDLESGASGAELSTVLRLAHTLKGAARVVKQREIADLTHALEDALTPYRDRGERPPREQITAVLAMVDAIGAHVTALPAGEVDATAPARALAPAPEIEPSARSIRADVADVDSLREGLGELRAEFASLREAAVDAERARHLALTLAGQLSPLRGQGVRRSFGAAVSPVRSLADELHRSVARIERRVAGGVERLEREVRQVGEKTDRLRLMPASVLVDRLQRLVRDSAESVGKRVAFVARGADVRLESDVLDGAQTALVQIVLNAIIHGIELPDDRVRARKPAEGLITLDVIRRGNQLVFRCTDDGRGVDLDGVRRALERKGAVASAFEGMSPPDLLRELLKGGVTTAPALTGLAGRGIGLGVVREVGDRLGGDVTVQTAAGSGTTIELRVRASLVSFDALVVEAGGARAALPLAAVRGARRVLRSEIIRRPAGDTIAHDEREVPLSPLAALLARAGTPVDVPHGQPNPDVVSAVVVGGAHTAMAFVVDRLIGAETIVFRPLPLLAPVEALISGIYVDAAGRPRAVLNPGAIASGTPIARAAHSREAPLAPRPILVIDDSLTTRMLERSILESAGHEVALATSAEEGLEMVRRRTYGLILVDVEMPGMDGFTFVERIREDSGLRHTPCLLVTSLDAPEDRARGTSVGADGYIVKGAFDQAEFLRQVTALLGRAT